MSIKQTIIGIDPGLRHTGWGVVEFKGNSLSFVGCGVVSPKPSLPLAERLHHIHQELQKTCEIYQPNIAAIEETFVSINAASTLKLGNARGAILLSLSIANLEVHEYAARLVKKSITGSGRADKAQMAVMVKILLPACKNANAGEDAIDALAIAITHINHHNVIGIVS